MHYQAIHGCANENLARQTRHHEVTDTYVQFGRGTTFLQLTGINAADAWRGTGSGAVVILQLPASACGTLTLIVIFFLFSKMISPYIANLSTLSRRARIFEFKSEASFEVRETAMTGRETPQARPMAILLGRKT